MDESRINDVLADIKLPWITDEDRLLIEHRFGTETLGLFNEIIVFATYDSGWLITDCGSAYYETIRRLRHNYPYLNLHSVEKIATVAAYFWK